MGTGLSTAGRLQVPRNAEEQSNGQSTQKPINFSCDKPEETGEAGVLFGNRYFSERIHANTF